MEAISFRSVSQVQLFFFIWELVHCLANQCLKGKKETAASIGLLSTIRAAAWSGSMHLQKKPIHVPKKPMLVYARFRRLASSTC
jgi:hypothetical protein